MKRTFALLLLVLLAAAGTSSAFEILKPGDTVKGKRITLTYFCYTQDEQNKISKSLDELSLSRSALMNREIESKELRAAIREKDEASKILKDTIDLQKKYLQESTEKARQLIDKVDQLLDINKREKKRSRRNFFKGLFLGGGAVIGILRAATLF